jgi:hypothetical protein
VLGAHRGKIAPGFAPPDDAVLVLDAHQDHGPVAHHAERRDDRRFDRSAVNARLD